MLGMPIVTCNFYPVKLAQFSLFNCYQGPLDYSKVGRVQIPNCLCYFYAFSTSRHIFISRIIACNRLVVLSCIKFECLYLLVNLDFCFFIIVLQFEPIYATFNT